MNPETVAGAIDHFTEKTGRAISWLVLALVLLICYDVAMRYLFHSGSIALQELEWHLFALLFLLGGAYTLKHDQHVRVDLVYSSRFISDRGRAIITIAGTVLFLMPFCLLVVLTSWPFVENAFHYREASPDPGGLPFRFLLKGAIVVGFGLIMLQGVAEILRQVALLRHGGAR